MLPLLSSLFQEQRAFGFKEIFNIEHAEFSLATVFDDIIQERVETSFQNYLKNFSLPLINLHGEILARIFPERPTAGYIWNEENGFYAVDTIKRFNRDFSNKTLKKNFQQSALRLRYLQDALRVHDTDLLIGVAPPR